MWQTDLTVSRRLSIWAAGGRERRETNQKTEVIFLASAEKKSSSCTPLSSGFHISQVLQLSKKFRCSAEVPGSKNAHEETEVAFFTSPPSGTAAQSKLATLPRLEGKENSTAPAFCLSTISLVPVSRDGWHLQIAKTLI